jgi:2-polyprenyl-6-hydroxyphenyl methylase/3-demethylubiquinone-9 3-methyltransferase
MTSSANVSITYKPDDAVAYHGNLAAEWDDRYQKRSFQARLEVLKECLQGRPLAGTQWLDAGCGTGTLTRFLAEQGCSITGLDAAPQMIEVARAKAHTHPQGGQMRFKVSDSSSAGTIQQLPDATASLDGILCSSVLEYMPDPERIVGEFARVLKPGGILLISVPNAHSVVRRAQVNLYRVGRRLRQEWLPFIEYSRNEYSAAEFETLLTAHHFRPEKMVVFGSPIPRWLQRQRWGGSLLMFAAVRSQSRS